MFGTRFVSGFSNGLNPLVFFFTVGPFLSFSIFFIDSSVFCCSLIFLLTTVSFSSSVFGSSLI
ncbi:hypothetical protein RchiOBHm_Chr1g0336691 [Rosa chinensis]|uniref:Uncharacterized protein n=1 Tax=Rosa chinensis TaxID=74649 RepID=A0A2P6SCR0_ROSCH|nr:hypothetical protein RchiOBHm_Chr1g0336691 [Rosa chinensis]